MPIISSSHITNLLTLGVFAHANAGKTTVTEQILYHTNVIDSFGRVDTGNTISDSMQIERDRGISVRASVVSFDLYEKHVQLIDTPGHIDFLAEVEKAISVLDAAVLVISGVEGVEPQTYTIWQALKEKSIPTIIFINKMDRIGADYKKVLDDIKNELEKNICPMLSVNKTENGNIGLTKISRTLFLEILTEQDDQLLELYLNDDQRLTIDYLEKKAVTLTQKCKLYPVIGGSALSNIGISELLDIIYKYMPIFSTEAYIGKKFCAFVYLVRNENNNRNIYAKIVSGPINIRDSIQVSNDKVGKITGLYRIKGFELSTVDSAICGQIVVINGLNSKPGDIIGDLNGSSTYLSFVNPLLVMQVAPVNKSEVIELVEALKILTDEDPYLNVRYDALTGKIYINLMGKIQAEIIENILLDRFKIKASFSNPMIMHKEAPTISGVGKASYTVFSAIGIEVKPLPSGTGVVYNSKFSTDYLHKKYQSQAEKLIKHYIRQGLYGWEITDAEISLIDGRFNSAGSNPSHFNIIVPIALMRALKNSNIKILQPISTFKLITPKDYLSVILQSIKDKEGVFSIIKEEDNKVLLSGEMASKNVLNYQIEVVKLTSGRGVVTSELSRYEISNDQTVTMEYYGPDSRNEVKFIVGEMGGSLDAMDVEFSKKKKASRSKFNRQQQEKNR